MAELALPQRTTWDGQSLPKMEAGSELRAIAPRPMLSVASYPGRVSTTQDATRDAIGAALPEPGRWISVRGFEIASSDLDTWFCWADDAQLDRLKAAVAGKAATVDQSSGWAGLTLSGPEARAVLARVTPLDIRAASFRPGQAARTEVAHMSALLLAKDGSFDIWVMRSFARTLLHDLGNAMKSVGAQRS